MPDDSLRLRDILGFLVFRPKSIRRVAAHRSGLWVGLAFVFVAALARNYDSVDLAAKPYVLLRSFAASVAGILTLWVVTAPLRRRPRGSENSPERDGLDSIPPAETVLPTIATCYWMTAPLALLYAIPVERMADPLTAARLNVWLLAVVSFWRVALMIVVFRELFVSTWFKAVVGVSAFCTLAAVAVLFANLGQIAMAGMAGVVPSEAEAVLLTPLTVVSVVALHGSPIAFILLLIASARADIPKPLPPRTTGPVSPAVWAAAGVTTAALLTAAVLVTQAPQRVATDLTKQFESDPVSAVRRFAETPRDQLPPGWSPPRSSGAGYLQGLGRLESPPTHVATEILRVTAGRYGDNWDELSEDEIRRLKPLVESLPDDQRFNGHRRRLAAREQKLSAASGTVPSEP